MEKRRGGGGGIATVAPSPFCVYFTLPNTPLWAWFSLFPPLLVADNLLISLVHKRLYVVPLKKEKKRKVFNPATTVEDKHCCFALFFSFLLPLIQHGGASEDVSVIIFYGNEKKSGRRLARPSCHMISDKTELPDFNMVVGSAELRILLMILSSCWFGSGGCSQNTSPRVLGLRLEETTERVYMRDRVLTAARGSSFKLRLFSSYLLNETWVTFAKEVGASVAEDACSQETLRNASAFQVRGKFEADKENGGLIIVQTEDRIVSDQVNDDTQTVSHCLCVFNGEKWQSAGLDRFRVKDPDLPPEWIPTWGLAVIIILVVLICSLVRCLNLSLLSLDPLELYVLHSCGSEDERRLAKRLEPIRRRGNFLVCSLLFLCALGHSVLGVIFYCAFGSILPAAFACAALIFLVAELLPYIISSGYGFYLAPGLVWLAQSFLIITCPLSCPLGLFLDLSLRRDVSTCGVREKVMELIRANINDPYSEFVKEEFRRGTLRSKTVEDILTPLKDCFMLPSTAVLDFNTMSEIMQSGYTRVPVYEEERSNIVEILYIKDLALVDPADCTPMTTITKFYNHPLHFVFNDTKLDAMLEEFKKGGFKVKL